MFHKPTKKGHFLYSNRMMIKHDSVIILRWPDNKCNYIKTAQGRATESPKISIHKNGVEFSLSLEKAPVEVADTLGYEFHMIKGEHGSGIYLPSQVCFGAPTGYSVTDFFKNGLICAEPYAEPVSIGELTQAVMKRIHAVEAEKGKEPRLVRMSLDEIHEIGVAIMLPSR